MKTQVIMLFVLFSLISIPIVADLFIPLTGGNWGDMEIWYGIGGTGPLPGPYDDVIIPGNTEIFTGGGTCRNLTINGGGSPGRLVSGIYGCLGFSIYGNLICDGYILTSPNTDFHMYLAGNLTLGYNATVRLTTFNFHRQDDQITGLCVISQDPYGVLCATFSMDYTVPGIILLSDLHLNDGQNWGTLNNIDVYLNGHKLSMVNLNSCNLPCSPDCIFGALEDCNLGSINAWPDISTYGQICMTNNSVAFHSDLINYGTIWGVFAESSTLVCEDVVNNGVIVPNWYGAMECSIAGNWTNNGATNSSLLFTAEVIHHYSQTTTAIQNGNLVNVSPNLILDSDMTFQSGDVTVAGQIDMCGFFIYNTTINSGILTTGNGGLDNCSLQSLNINGSVWLSNEITILDNAVLFNGEVVNLGTIFGAFAEITEVNINSDLDNYGMITPGISGGLNLNCLANVYNAGAIHGTMLTLLSAIPCILDWAPSSSFNIDLNNQSPMINLFGNSQINFSGRVWTLASCNFTQSCELYHGTVQHSTCNGNNLLTLADMELFTTEFNLPVACSGVWIRDNYVVFNSPVQVNGDLMGGNLDTIITTCNSSIAVAVEGRVTCYLDGVLVLDCFGDIVNQGSWLATAKIKGEQSRNLLLVCPLFPIYIEGSSHPVLIGANTLSPFQIEGGSSLTVSPGASLQMAEINDYYIAEPGCLINHGTFQNDRYLDNFTLLQYYNLQVVPGTGMVNEYSSLNVCHQYNYAPTGMDGALPEMWSITPTGFTQNQTGQLTFTHSTGLLPRDFETNLELWYLPLGQSNWQPYPGTYSYSLSNHTYTADEIIVGGDYIFVLSQLEMPTGISIQLQNTPLGVKPRIQWSAVSGAGYYEILATESLSSSWSICGFTEDTFWVDADVMNRKFYSVIAHTGNIP